MDHQGGNSLERLGHRQGLDFQQAQDASQVRLRCLARLDNHTFYIINALWRAPCTNFLVFSAIFFPMVGFVVNKAAHPRAERFAAAKVGKLGDRLEAGDLANLARLIRATAGPGGAPKKCGLMARQEGLQGPRVAGAEAAEQLAVRQEVKWRSLGGRRGRVADGMAWSGRGLDSLFGQNQGKRRQNVRGGRLKKFRGCKLNRVNGQTRGQ